MEDNNMSKVEEPAAAILSEEVRKSGLLSQVLSLSQSDKVALVKYLRQDTGTEDPFKTDEFGRITLSKEMRQAVVQAEREYEDGKCLSSVRDESAHGIEDIEEADCRSENRKADHQNADQ